MKRNGFILSIDPDISKSGVALLDCAAGEFKRVEAMKFPELVDLLALISDTKAQAGEDVVVVIEDSDSSTNWHLDNIVYERRLTTAGKIRKAAAIGRSAGLCHAVARMAREIAEHYGLEVVPMKPLRKIWRGTDGKISHEEAAQFMNGIPTRTSQDVRDSMLLAWCYADFPIRVKP